MVGTEDNIMTKFSASLGQSFQIFLYVLINLKLLALMINIICAMNILREYMNTSVLMVVFFWSSRTQYIKNTILITF